MSLYPNSLSKAALGHSYRDGNVNLSSMDGRFSPSSRNNVITLRREDFLAYARVEEAQSDPFLAHASVDELNAALIAAFGMSAAH